MPAGLIYARSKFAMAVQILDDRQAEAKDRLFEAGRRFISVSMEDFPPILAADYVSLRHRLTWRRPDTREASLQITVDSMDDEDLESAGLAIRRLYVDLLAIAPQDLPHAEDDRLQK